jgi:threonine synthase
MFYSKVLINITSDYAINVVSNGKEAIDLAKKELPDLIILDLMMPEIDGFSVLDSLKDSPETASIPVIVVTAKELTTEDLHRLSGRIRTYMQKGEFMDNELLEEVKAQVG